MNPIENAPKGTPPVTGEMSPSGDNRQSVRLAASEPPYGSTASGSETVNDEPKICDYLRAKVTGAPHNDKRAIFALREDATTVYWCLLTMSPAGPDDGLVHANRCGPGRSCCTRAGDQDRV